MTPRFRGLRFALVIVGLAAVIGPARLASAADDDFEFAQALSDRGYQDLAEEQFNELLNDSKKSAKEKAEGQYGLALIKRYNARIAAGETRERLRKPMPEVLGLFEEAEAALKQFIDRNTGHERLLAAKLDRAKLITDRADYIDRAIENDWVPADVTVAELKAQVASGYDTAIGLLKAGEDVARADLEKEQPNTESYSIAEEKLGTLWLYKIVALYGKGAALPDGDTAGVAALTTAVDEIGEFMWLFDGTVKGLWAFHYSALCNWRLDKPKDAIRDMRDAATYVEEADGNLVGRAIALLSYQKLGEIAIAIAPRHGDEYLDTAESVFETLPTKWPTFLEDAAGQRAALSHARVLAALGNATAALELVQTVIRKAEEKGTRVNYDAGKVLSDLLAAGGGGGAALDPALLNRIAMSKWADSDMRGAIKGFQAVIGACSTPEQMDEFGWRAWDFIGRCYGVEGRYYEAYLAFAALETSWSKDKQNAILAELTNETGFSAASAINALAVETKDKSEQKRLTDLKDELYEDFTKNHPDSPRNQSLDYRSAEKKRQDAQNLRRAGDHAAALAAFAEARQLYAKIEKTNPSIDKIGARLAQMTRLEALCHQGLGDDAKALAGLEKAIQESKAWLAEKRAPAEGSEVRRARAAGRNISLTNILTSLSLTADVTPDAAGRTAAYEGLLTALTQYEDEFIKSANRGQSFVDQWRAEAFIGIVNIDRADELVSKLIADNPALPNGPYLAALVAKAREAEAREWEKKTDFDRARDLYIRAAKLREYAINQTSERTGKTSPASLKFLGDTFKKAEAFGEAEAYYRAALAAYEAKSQAEQARALRIELIGLLIAQGKFDEAIPQLEVLLVPAEADRAKVLERLGANDQINTDELKDLLKIMSNNRRILDLLSSAYLKAGRNEKDYLRCINIAAIMIYAHPKDDRHDAAFIGYQLRLAGGYLRYGLLTGKPEAFRAASSLVTNRVVIPGLLDTYNETVPGSKKQFEEILAKAKEKL